MEIFRGDTIAKTIKSNYTFQKGDVIHYAVMNNAFSKDKIFESKQEIQETSDTVDIVISASETSKFPVGTLLFEIEITYADNYVKTNQYKLEVKADGIYE